MLILEHRLLPEHVSAPHVSGVYGVGVGVRERERKKEREREEITILLPSTPPYARLCWGYVNMSPRPTSLLTLRIQCSIFRVEGVPSPQLGFRVLNLEDSRVLKFESS